MKYIRYILAVIVLSLFASHANAALGPLVISLTAKQQSLIGTPTSRTNIVGTTTNITTVARFTTTNLVVNNAKMLKMLENSFNTNFPAGAVLKLNEVGHPVVALGTNVVLDVSSVVQLELFGSPHVYSGNLNANQRTTPTTTNAVETIIFTESFITSFTYDDSALTTADGTTTTFTVTGACTLHITENIRQVNGVTTATVTFVSTLPAAGEGTIAGKDSIIKGVVSEAITTNEI